MKRVFFFLLILLPLGLFAQNEVRMAPVTVVDSQAFGFGGPHAAWTDNVYGLFVNPAAIRRANRGSAFELSFAVPQLFDVLGKIGDVDTGKPSTLVNLFTDSETGALRFGPGVTVRFPLSIGYAGNGFAFGIWDQIGIDARVQNTTLSLGVRFDFITSFGISTSVVELQGHTVDVGIAAKPFVRVMTYGIEDRDAKEFLSNLNDINLDTLLEGAGIPVIAGLGLDAGIMYRFHNFASFGISFSDIVTRGVKVAELSSLTGIEAGKDIPDTYYVPFSLNIGASGSVRLGDFFSTLPPAVAESYIAVMADWRDVLNQHWGSTPADINDGTYPIRNPILNLSFGAELGLFRFLRIRAGISEMLPSFGVGLHFGAFQITSSIYGIELGNEPGQFSTYAVNFGIAVRPESKPRAKPWPWNGPIVNKALGIR